LNALPEQDGIPPVEDRLGERARVYPGTSVRRAIDLTDVPAGAYKALLVADAGDESVYGATYALLLER
jgi:hypothetical protein